MIKKYKYNLRNEGTPVSSHPKSTNTTFGMKVLLCQAIQRVQIQPSEWMPLCQGTLVSSHPKSTNTTCGMKVLLCQVIQRVQIQPSEWRYPCVKPSKEYKYNLRNEDTLVSSHPKSTNTTFGMKVLLCQAIQRVQIQPSEWRYSCVKPSKEYKYNLRNEGTLVSSHPKSTNTTFGMKVPLCQAIQRLLCQAIQSTNTTSGMKIPLCQVIQRVQIQPSEWRYSCVKPSKEYKYNLRNEGTPVSSHLKSTNTTSGMKIPLCQVIQRVQIQPSEWRYSCVKPSKEYKYNLRNEGTPVSSHPKSTNTTFGMKVPLCQVIQRVQIQPSEWRYPCVKSSKEYKYNLRNEGTLVSSHPKSTNTTFGMKVLLCQAIQREQIQPSEWRYSCIKSSKEYKYNLRNEGTLVSSHPKRTNTTFGMKVLLYQAIRSQSSMESTALLIWRRRFGISSLMKSSNTKPL